MTDSRIKSLSEAGINLMVGFSINYVANIFILPPFASRIGHVDLLVFAEIGFWFTLVSLVRQYVFRRLFERFGEKENLYTLTIRLVNRIKSR